MRENKGSGMDLVGYSLFCMVHRKKKAFTFWGDGVVDRMGRWCGDFFVACKEESMGTFAAYLGCTSDVVPPPLFSLAPSF